MRNKIIWFVSLIAAIITILVVVIIGVIHIAPPSPNKLFKKSVQSIVELKAVSENVGESFGTAVCIKSDGYLVTNAHVVTYKQMGESVVFDEYFIRLANEDKYHAIELIKYNSETDIAVLKISDTSVELKPIEMGNSDKLSIGDKVYAIGNGSKYGLSITCGIISTPKINVEYEDTTREVI